MTASLLKGLLGQMSIGTKTLNFLFFFLHKLAIFKKNFFKPYSVIDYQMTYIGGYYETTKKIKEIRDRQT